MATSTSMDTLFKKEFKLMMEGRKSLAKSTDLANIPVPKLPEMLLGTPKLKLATVKGIETEYFERLNKQMVEIVPRTSLQKRQVLSDGSFRKDKNGKYVTDPVPVPHNSVAILSTLSIGLKNVVVKNGKKIKYHTPEGFKYVDYIIQNGVRKYIYIVPKKHVYRYNLCALVLTQNKRKNFYKGARLALQNGVYIYLYVIPYTYRQNIDQRILGVKPSYDFTKQYNLLLKAWQSKGILFDLSKTTLDDQVKGITNLAIEEYEGTIVADDFLQLTGKSLAEEKKDDIPEFV